MPQLPKMPKYTKLRKSDQKQMPCALKVETQIKFVKQRPILFKRNTPFYLFNYLHTNG